MTTIEAAKTMRKSQVIKALQGLGVTNIRPSGKFAIIADLDYGRGTLNGLYDPRDLLVELTAGYKAETEPAPAPEAEVTVKDLLDTLRETVPMLDVAEPETAKETEMSDQAMPEIEFDQTVPEAETVLDVVAEAGQTAPVETEMKTEKKAPKARKLTPAPKPGKAPKGGKKMTDAEKVAMSAKAGAQTKKMSGGKTAKAAKPAKAEKAPKTAKAPASPKAPKVKRLELTSRQREVLIEDAKDSGLKADVTAGKQVTMTAGAMKDLSAFAAIDKDPTRQRVYTGLLARAEIFVKENGLVTR